MRENEEKNTWISIELTTTVESWCGIPVSNKRMVSLEGLEIVAGLIRKDRIDALKHGMKILLLLTDAMRSCPESSNMASHGILFFGWDDGRNMEGLGSIGVDVFSIVLISQADDNKDCF